MNQTKAKAQISVMTDNDDLEVGYMCKVDFDHEVYHASGGNVIYPSIEDLKENHECWESCGIVAVGVVLKKVILETDYEDRKVFGTRPHETS